MTSTGRWEPPAGAARLDESMVAPLVPVRPEDGHKGTFGTLVAVSGSLDLVGAALLSGTAALRAGAGLVVLAVPASLQPIVAGRIPELMTVGLPETAPHQVEPLAAAAIVAGRRHDALLVGPGLRPGPTTVSLVMALLAPPAGAVVPPAAVVDAEALNSLSTMTEWWAATSSRLVMTPHPGEFARLDGSSVGPGDVERVERAAAAASRWHQVVVLKGARTVVAAPDGAIAVADAPNPALATGGTGDVLAGVVGSLLAQGMAPWDAARLGVHLHGAAGRLVRERLGDAGSLASDLLLELPRARRQLAERALHMGPDRRRFGFATEGRPSREGGA